MPTNRGLLRSDDRGAMMLLGIFMTTIVIGMLYYLAGVGETITYRERMQDAVDSGAFAGSLLYARTMNVIVLLNLAVASVFAVAVAAYAAIFLLMTASGLASAECDPPWSITPCIVAACLMTCAVPQACDNADDMRDIAKDVASNAHTVANNLATGARAVALVASGEIIMGHYNPPVSVGAGLGPAMPLADESPTHACSEILAFSGPGGFLSIPPDSPIITTSELAYEIARPYASDCDGTSYLNEAAASSILYVYLSCYLIRSDIDGKTKKIKDGVNLGDGEFQFRTFAMASEDAMPFENNQERVALVTYGHEDGGSMDSIVETLQTTARFSVAQGEYYWDDDDDREMWTWRLKWRARLRRFGFRDGEGASGCPGFMGSVCNTLNSLVIH